jgi:hypothetical protein
MIHAVLKLFDLYCPGIGDFEFTVTLVAVFQLQRFYSVE